LFLGAGASTPFDYPTTEQFKSRLQQALGDDSANNRLLKDILSRERIKDIEDVLSSLDQVCELESLPLALSFLTDIWHTEIRAKELALVPNKDLIPYAKAIREIVRDAVFTYYQPKPESDSDIRTLYNRVLEALFRFTANQTNQKTWETKGKAVVVTTNYDPVIERFCGPFGLKLRDGFEGNPTTERGNWNPTWSFSDFSHDAVYLLKLHGSLNWRKQRVTNEIVRVPVSERVPRQSGEYLDNALLYPGSKGVPTEEPFKTLFATFEKLLKDAYTCVVLGYRFRDDNINAHLLRFLQDDRKALFVLSPHSEGNVRENLRAPSELMGKRILTKPDEFSLTSTGLVKFLENARSRSET
jgi:hypothetical protein